uniref:Arginase n=1 Tax=Syphacia muris TaxID=451379 RepID=A0A0N5AYK2_9BILA
METTDSTLQLDVIGCANGYAGRELGCEKAADTIKNSKFLENFGLNIKWRAIVEEHPTGRHLEAIPAVNKTSSDLAEETSKIVNECKNFAVVGGDHSCAIGTWSGIAHGLRSKGDIGIIWVDAHLDAHTPESSETGNLHGMSAAHLLGFGDKGLCRIGDEAVKVLPQNLTYIGIRSYEPPERKLLESLGVRIFYIEEVDKRGIYACLTEAIEHVSKNTIGFGLSIDIDGFRVIDAPAVGTPVDGGIIAAEFLESVKKQDLSNLITAEIVEFLPRFDDANKTRQVKGF